MRLMSRLLHSSQRQITLWMLCGIVFGLALAVLALRPAAAYHMPIEDNLDIHTQGLKPTEFGDGRMFRWLEPSSDVQLPGMAQADHTLTLLVHEGNQRNRDLAATLDGVAVLHAQLKPGWQIVHVLLPASALRSDSPRNLAFQVAPLKRKPWLGVAIAGLTIEQINPGLPQFGTLLAFGLCVGLLGLITLAAGLPTVEAVVTTSVMTIGICACLLNYAMPTALILRNCVPGLAICAVLVGTARLLAWRTWPREHAWLARSIVLAVGLFLIHAAGMQALRFIEIDHMARANHMLNMAKGDAAGVQARLSNQYEWGIASVPYSLLSYRALMPLTWFFPYSRPLTEALKVAVSLIDATTALLLYALVRLGGGSPRAGWFAALLFAALPVTHIYFHDGSYPTIIGLWVSVAALVALALFARATKRSSQVLWALASIVMLTLGALIYVTQAAFLPMVVGMAGLSLALFWRDQRGWQIVGMAVTAVLLAILLYYGGYILPVVQAILPQLQAGAHLGVDSGRLPGPLVGPFWLQAWGHTRILPLVLMLLGIAVLIRRGDRFLGAIGVGYVTLLGLMSTVDLRFSMWNKHWYFALPGIALLAAFGCEWLANRGPILRYTTFAMLTVLLAVSAVAWSDRALFYQWSLWSL